MRAWGLALALLGWAPSAWAEGDVDQAIETLEAELEEARPSLDKAERALARIVAEESSVLEEWEAAEAELREAEEAHARARARADEAREALEPARAAEAEAARALAAELETLRPRLVARYRLLRRGQGEPGDDPAVALRLRRSFDRILEEDLRHLRRARAAQRELEAARRRWEELAETARKEGEEAEARWREAAARRDERDRLLRGIQGEKRLLLRTQRELRRARARLEAELSKLERRRAEGALVGRRGTLPRPVEGAVVEVPFGKVVNAKFHTVTSHNGLDLRVAEGTPVRAIAQGTVAFAAWFRGYGNLVIVDHGAGTHTLYGYLASFDVQAGDEVEEGQVLGRVGETGSLKGPYLYFELRQGGQPRDPLPWFGARAIPEAE